MEGEGDRQWSSLIVPSVLEMVREQNFTTVPPRYVRSDQEKTEILDDSSLSTEIPVIDMKRLCSVSAMDSELKKLDFACQDWGFFQLVNHGIDSSFLDKLETEVQDFFSLPMEEKKKLWQRSGEFEGFGQVNIVSEDQNLDWGDMFILTTEPIRSRKSLLFSKLPPSFRETIEAYSYEVKSIAKILFAKMANVLEIKSVEMEDLFEDVWQSIKINYYPPCPEPDQVMGLTPHSDAAGLTILLQVNQVEGLQIKKDGKWAVVKPLRDALVVNVGEILELSSNSDNRLFWIKFGIRNAKEYPFLQAVSNPIRCISVSPDVRPLSVTPKRLTNIDHPSSTESPDLLHNTSSVKRIRLGKESVSGSEESYQRCNSHPETSRQFENGNDIRLHEEDNSSTDSENSEMRYTISDSTIFRYCLGNLQERSLLLKEITNNSSDDEVLEFANQVSLYSGCSHHCYQINMARKLIAEGTNAWILISRNNQHVHWDNVVYEIEELFMRISKCSSRSLTHQDFELLRRISGCYEYITKENFEKMWCWLFPVAYSISRSLINGMWRSSSPRWVEGFITKEEAEHSLQGQEPGTFILRFPISRSWPHPDAGSLVVTYVGHDLALHHKQLKIDNICESSERYMDPKLLQDLLLAERELSRLGRITRNH